MAAKGGRPRKPVEQHILDGTFREDRHGPRPDESELALPPPTKPAGLPKAVAAKWDAAVRLLAGVVKERDGPMLVELCRWLARADMIAVRLDAMKATGKGLNALLVAAGIASDKVSRLSGLFGLSPADRARLRAESPVQAKPKVASRPRTALDRKGAPKK